MLERDTMSNAAFNFTDKNIQKVAPTGKREYYHDLKEKDLLLQVTKTGTKTFYLYKKINGEPTRIKLGDASIGVKKARAEAIKNRIMIVDGVNPQHVRRDLRDENTVSEMFKRFMKEKNETLAESTLKEYNRIWETDLKDIIGKKKLSQIDSNLLRRIHKNKGDKKYIANRCIVLIKSMFNYFIREGLYKENNPAISVKLYKEDPRIRYMTNDELERFFSAFDSLAESVSKYAILLLLYTGVRKANVLYMKWDELDLRSKIWRIPVTKTGKNETLALADEAIKLLKEVKEKYPSDTFVFPSSTSKSGHLEDIKRVWETIKKRADIPDLRLHDLRHTFATYMIANGANQFITQRALLHKNIQSTNVYVNLGVEHLRGNINDTVNNMRNIGKRKKEV